MSENDKTDKNSDQLVSKAHVMLNKTLVLNYFKLYPLTNKSDFCIFPFKKN